MLISKDSNSIRLPLAIRGMAMDYIEQIKNILVGFKYVFIISGLGGNVGSGLSPFFAKIAKDIEATVVSIVAMPFKFEKHKHFYAGLALRQMRKLSDAVIIIDNESLREKVPKKSMLDVFTFINKKISTAFNKLINPPKVGEVGIGLNKFINIIKEEGYAILSVYKSFVETGECVSRAAQSVSQIAEPNQSSRAILYLMGDKKISTEETSTSISSLGSFFGNDSIEIQYGISESGGHGSTAILLASGLRNTKFDDYDPIANILYNLERDDDLDTSINVKLPNIYNLNECPA